MTAPNQPMGMPVVLELAPLPRQQAGPFLLLGVDKDADKETIEAAWAQRLIWSRKGQLRTPLEDINWSRETLNESARRLQADASSLNIDTTAGTLKRFGQGLGAAAGCKPLDVEKDLKGFTPPGPIPTVEEVRQTIQVPDIPREVPAVAALLEDFVREPVDPWSIMGK